MDPAKDIHKSKIGRINTFYGLLILPGLGIRIRSGFACHQYNEILIGQVVTNMNQSIRPYFISWQG